MRNYIFLLLLLTAAAATLSAQDKGELTVKAQVRPRFEYNHGAQTPLNENNDPISFISTRTRLSLNYNNGFLSMGISGQDISVWGQKSQTDNVPNTTLNEAWAKIYKDGFFAQLGRQQLAYDDDRILGTLDWHQAGRWHDALRMGYEDNQNKAHLILAYNQTPRVPGSGTFYENGGQPYKYMQTAYYQWKGQPGLDISMILMNLGFQGGSADNASVNNLQTFGGNVSYKWQDVTLFGTGYYQTGTNSADKKAAAYLLAAKVKYDLLMQKLSFVAGIDYLSGQEAGNEKATWFNPLYGTHHKFYGAMDYFYASAYPTYGLSDLYLSAIIKPVGKLSIDAAYHYFSTQQPVELTDKKMRALGSEIDFTFTYPLRANIVVQAGYSMMFGTDAFFFVKGGTDKRMQHWGFFSVNINPQIFSAR